MTRAELQHKVVSSIRAVAEDVGHIPGRNEFIVHPKGLTRAVVEQAFGLWTEAVKACGFERSKPVEKKSERLKDPELSAEDAREVIKGNQQRKTYTVKSYEKILVIGDAHHPWCDAAALSMVYAIIEKEQPDVVVQVGDLMDMFAQSRFPRSLNIMTPREEMNLARSQSVDMWEKICGIVPNAKKFQLLGNHCIRPLKQVIDKWPEGEDFVSKAFQDLYTFDGVTTIYDPREELFIGDIAFIHGYRSKLGDHSKYMRMNVVCGHSHRPGVFFHQVNGQTKWELNAGYIADPFSAALTYRAQRLHDWTTGCAIVDSNGPRFIPFG